VQHVQHLLEQIGLEPERVKMCNLSSAMAGEFVRVAQDMTERIATLGPNPLKGMKAEG